MARGLVLSYWPWYCVVLRHSFSILTSRDLAALVTALGLALPWPPSESQPSTQSAVRLPLSIAQLFTRTMADYNPELDAKLRDLEHELDVSDASPRPVCQLDIC